MSGLGTFNIDDVVTFSVNTHTPSTGAATDADSVPSYRVYEDETGTAILTGSMAKLDDTNTTGFYSEQLTLSAANGFENGKSYNIYISATVGGVTGTESHQLQVALQKVNVTQVGGQTASATAGVDFDDLASILVDTGTTIPAQITALNDLSAAEVNAEVLDVLNTDTFAEPSSVPAATASLVDKLGWVCMVSRNKLTQTSTTATVYADDTTTAVATSTVSDDGTTGTRGEYS